MQVHADLFYFYQSPRQFKSGQVIQQPVCCICNIGLQICKSWCNIRARFDQHSPLRVYSVTEAVWTTCNSIYRYHIPIYNNQQLSFPIHLYIPPSPIPANTLSLDGVSEKAKAIRATALGCPITHQERKWPGALWTPC